MSDIHLIIYVRSIPCKSRIFVMLMCIIRIRCNHTFRLNLTQVISVPFKYIITLHQSTILCISVDTNKICYLQIRFIILQSVLLLDK